MPGRVPGIHVFLFGVNTWMAGPSSAEAIAGTSGQYCFGPRRRDETGMTRTVLDDAGAEQVVDVDDADRAAVLDHEQSGDAR